MTDPVQHEEKGKSSLWLAYRVFDEPTAVFRELAARPRFMQPIYCLIAVAIFSAFLTPARVLEEQTRSSLAPFEESGRMTPEAVQEAVAEAASSRNRWTILAAGAGGGVVSLVVAAFVLILIFGATSSERLCFKDEFAIVSHAYMISLAGAMLALILVLAGLDDVKLTLGFLFNEESSPFLHRFTNQINLFGAWNVYVLALGNQIKTQAKGIGGALTIVGGLWLGMKVVGALVGTLIAGMGS